MKKLSILTSSSQHFGKIDLNVDHQRLILLLTHKIINSLNSVIYHFTYTEKWFTQNPFYFTLNLSAITQVTLSLAKRSKCGSRTGNWAI